jgi:hypothetical protein
VPVMTKKKPARGRSRERGDSVPFMFELSPDLNAALEACAERDLRTKRAVVTLALQDYLQRQGLWTPPGGKK